MAHFTNKITAMLSNTRSFNLMGNAHQKQDQALITQSK